MRTCWPQVQVGTNYRVSFEVVGNHSDISMFDIVDGSWTTGGIFNDPSNYYYVSLRASNELSLRKAICREVARSGGRYRA